MPSAFNRRSSPGRAITLMAGVMVSGALAYKTRTWERKSLKAQTDRGAMPTNTPRIAGRHFLQIPGPTPVPDRILRAMDRAVIDHRGPEFQKLGQRVLS